MKTDLHIVSTRVLEQQLVQRLESAGIRVTEANFIQKSFSLPEKIDVGAIHATIILTSKTAVHAWMRMVEKFNLDKQQYRVYCLSMATQALAQENNLPIAGVAYQASSLADIILNDKALSKVTFVCGNLRRDELPVKLRKNNVHVSEIVAYKTEHTPLKIEPTYNGVLFFSPSTVDSFLLRNTTHDATAFCLGSTTADHCRKSGFSEIQVAEVHTPESLVNKVIHYYQ